MKAGALATLSVLLVAITATCAQGETLAFAFPAGNGVTALIRQDGKVDFGATPGAVTYDKNGRINRIGNLAIVQTGNGQVVKVGLLGVQYDDWGRVKSIGSIPVGYDKAGRLATIGTASIKYNRDGSVKLVGKMDGMIMFLGTN